MGVIDGQAVSAAVTNPAFINKNQDDVMPGILGLSNTDIASGPTIDNTQRVQNRLLDATGVQENPDAANGMDYSATAPNERVVDGENHEISIAKLDAAFNDTTGHAHSGAVGDGTPVESESIANTPITAFPILGTDFTTVAAPSMSTDVSAYLVGKTPSTGPTVLGVIVSVPDNRIIIRQSAPAANENNVYTDVGGNIVYGRLTESAGVWTLSYYSLILGVETAYSFAASSRIRWYYSEIYNPLSSSSPPPVYSPNFVLFDTSNAASGITPIAQGGTGASTATAGFNNLSPLTTVGDLIAHDGTDNVRVPVGADGEVLTADSAEPEGVRWAASATAPDQSYEISNASLLVTVAANAMTIALKDKSGANPSVGSPVKIGFRSDQPDIGDYVQRMVTAALSLVISSGSTLGMAANRNHYIYVYLVDDGGTVRLAASLSQFSESFEATLPSTTAEGGAGGADSNQLLYAVSTIANVPIRLLGRLQVNLATPGTWSVTPSEIIVNPLSLPTEYVAATVTRAAGQVLGALASSTKIQFDSLVYGYDTHNSFDTVTNFNYTIPSAGTYRIFGSITVAAGTNAGHARADLYVNGSISKFGRVIKNATTSAGDISIAYDFVCQLAANDTVHIQVLNNIVASLTVAGDATAAYYTNLSIMKINQAPPM